jgi:hypothetical protein
MEIKANSTIEEWFLSQTFPVGEDYASRYKIIKEFLIPIHEEVKSVVAKIDPTVYLNAHGCGHIKMVIEKMTMVLSHGKIELSLYETYLLLLATQFHDIGHIINGRDNHAEDAGKIISKISHQLLDSVSKKVIFDIASAHSGKDDPIGQLPVENTISNRPIRLRLLSAILRTSDELADGKERASNFLLELKDCKGSIPDKSKIYHVYSSCLNSCYIQLDSHSVCMKFYLNQEHAENKYKKKKKDIFLIDEIYNRTLTTFTECLYYNRFVPDSIRLNTVNVEINFLCSRSSKDFHIPIKYKIEEHGYPTIPRGDIFDLCKNDLVKDGAKIDGQYIANQINN